MFSRFYGDVAYFGQWADETADLYGRRDALAVLQHALETCAEADPMTAELAQAIAYLSVQATRPAIVARFLKALQVPEPGQRLAEAQAAYLAIVPHLVA